MNFIAVDLSILGATKNLARQIGTIAPQIEVLVSDAGGVSDRTELTKDDLEKTYVTNHLGPAPLTLLLLPSLFATARERGSARVIGFLSSGHEQCTGLAGLTCKCCRAAPLVERTVRRNCASCSF